MQEILSLSLGQGMLSNRPMLGPRHHKQLLRVVRNFAVFYLRICVIVESLLVAVLLYHGAVRSHSRISLATVVVAVGVRDLNLVEFELCLDMLVGRVIRMLSLRWRLDHNVVGNFIGHVGAEQPIHKAGGKLLGLRMKIIPFAVRIEVF